jgi:hypothetical protein
VFRNNIFNALNEGGGGTVFYAYRYNTSIPATNLEFYNNTCVSHQNSGVICFGGSNDGYTADVRTFRNNLSFAISGSISAPSCSGSCTADHNLTASSNPFVNTSYAVATDFMLLTGSAAMGAGASVGEPPNVPVYTDFGTGTRPGPPSVGAWDIAGSRVVGLGVPGQPTLVP